MFKYKGRSNKEMNLRVLNNITFASPSRDVNAIQVPGRDGDLIMDNGRFNSVIRSVPCRLEASDGANVEELISDLNNWLIDDGGFHDFTWDNDPGFRYLARVDEGLISQRVLSQYGNTTIDFKLHPIKYLESGLLEHQVTNGEVIANPFNIDAKPILKIQGATSGGGDINIEIGGRRLTLRGMAASGCIIDSESQTITDSAGRVTLFSIMRSPFPVLTEGANRITIPNGVRVSIIPRFGRLI